MLEGLTTKLADFKPSVSRQIVDQVWHGPKSMWPDTKPVRLSELDDSKVLSDLISFDELRKEARALSPQKDR